MPTACHRLTHPLAVAALLLGTALLGCGDADPEFGSRQTLTELPKVEEEGKLRVTDFNEDGQSDLLVETSGPATLGYLYVLRGASGARFHRELERILTFPSPVVADFVSGPLPDIAYHHGRKISLGGNFRLLENQNQDAPGDTLSFQERSVEAALGKLSSELSGAFELTPNSIAGGDLNGDGNLDLAIMLDKTGENGRSALRTKSERLVWLKNQSQGESPLAFSEMMVVDSLGEEGSPIMRATDLTGNDQADLILGGKWYENRLAERDTFLERPLPSAPFQSSPDRYRTFEDLNGDGRSDIVYATGESIRWAVQGNSSADSTWVRSGTVEEEIFPPRIPHLADVNGNGKPDLITASVDAKYPPPANAAINDNELAWYPNRSEGGAIQWGEKRVINDPNPNAWAGGEPQVERYSDVQGLLDGGLTLLSAGQFALRSYFQTPYRGDIQDVVDVTTADWDSDGDLDVLVLTSDGVAGYENRLQ